MSLLTRLVPPAFLILGLIYLFATPPFEASDEIWHYPFVQYLQRGLGLPIQQPRPEDNLARQEGGQPPLYYALAAALTFWVDSGLPGEGIEPNPHALVGVPLSPGNKNLAIHREGERWSGARLAVVIIRGFSLVLGLLSVLLVGWIVRQAIPGMPVVAVVTAALVAFNPEFIFISAAVNNDNLMTVLALAGLALMIATVQRDANWRRDAALGLVLGLALLSKLTSLGLLPLAGAVLVFAVFREALTLPPDPVRLIRSLRSAGAPVLARAMRMLVARGLIIFGLPALLAGWWYIRNWVLYGDPTGIAMFLRIVNTRNPPPPIWELVISEFEGFRISFWALFGGVNLLASDWTYRFYDGITVAGVVGFVVVVLNARLRSSVAVNPIVLLLVLGWALIVVTGILRWSQVTLASQGRLLYPAIAGLMLPLAIGLTITVPRRFQDLGAIVLVVCLGVVALLQPFLAIVPGYAKTPFLTPEASNSLRPRLDIDYGGQVRLIAAEIPEGPFSFGERIPITLTWQALRPVDQDYSVFVHVFGRIDRKVGQYDSYPGLGSRPFTTWQTGQILRETYPVLIEQMTEGPILMRVEVGIYEFRTGSRLPAVAGGQAIGTSPIVGRVRLGDPPYADRPNRVATGTFGSVIGIEGATFGPAERLPSGDSRPPAYALALFLRPSDPITRDYTLFAHIVDRNGRILSQRDSPPVAGEYPTTAWQAGERIIDRREIPLPSAPDPTARIVVGFYDPATGTRLTLPDGRSELDLGEVGR